MKSPCVRIEPADEAQLKSLLVPYPSDGMIAWPVSARVGSVKNNDRSLIKPIHLPEASGDPPYLPARSNELPSPINGRRRH